MGVMNGGHKGFPVLIEPVEGEPWVRLPNGKDLEFWGKENEISYNQSLRQMEKYRMFVRAYDFLTENMVKGDYYEFGCHRCRTFRMSLTEARRHNLSEMQFHAFDSFQGLPEVETNPSVEIWEKGALATSEEDFMDMIREHGIYLENVKTIKGFYDESLTTELRNKYETTSRKAALINVDCDLYESAVPVFNFLEQQIQEGTLIYIDDLFCGYKGSPHDGVAQAFIEFQQRSEFKFLPHMEVGWWGRTYIAYKSDTDLEGVI